MSQDSDIKSKIKEKLDELVPGTLKTVIYDDFQPNIMEKDISSYPAAVLSTSSVTSERLTNAENQRTYTYEILIISKGEDVKTALDIEVLKDAILDKFDGNGTLDGTAISVEPASIPEAPVPTHDRSFILFSVLISANAEAEASC